MTIGENLRRLRRSKNMSQEDVAARVRGLGWSLQQPTVSAIERGIRELTLVRAFMLCAALDVMLDELIPENELIGLPDEGLIVVTMILERWGDYPRGASAEERRSFVWEIIFQGVEHIRRQKPWVVVSEKLRAPRGPAWRKGAVAN